MRTALLMIKLLQSPPQCCCRSTFLFVSPKVRAVGGAFTRTPRDSPNQNQQKIAVQDQTKARKTLSSVIVPISSSSGMSLLVVKE
eukprot:scaffold18636_cov136-Skeletonema_dohrnii-CCMP3373.AAC.5